MWLFENILNETGEFHPTFAKFVDGSFMDAIPELAENIISSESAAYVDIIHTNRAFELLEDCLSLDSFITGHFHLCPGLCCQETKMLSSISEELEHLSSRRLAGTRRWRLHSLSDRLVHWQ